MKTSLPVVGSVAAVVAIAAGVAAVSATARDQDPAPLRLASQGGAAARDAALAAGAPSGGSGYTLTGTLPAGTPDDAAAWTLPGGPADAGVVTALAKALHAGTPVRDGSGWRAGGLVVSGDAGQSWWYSACAKDLPVSSDPNTSTSSSTSSAPRIGCAVASPTVAGTPQRDDQVADPSVGSGGAGSAPSSGTATATAPAPPSPAPSPAPQPDPMPEADVQAAVRPVLDALSIDVPDAHVEGNPYGGSAVVPRTVGGLETVGLQTTVQVSRDGQVQNAGGYLGTPDRGDAYPLVSAQAAYVELPPVMTAMMCPVAPDGTGCLPPQPTAITGAHLGLLLSPLAGGGQALVPAWLFEVKGSDAALPVVAVQKQYLPAAQEPTPAPDPGRGEVPPAPPATEPASRQPFSFDRAARGTTDDRLVVTYGDSGSCPREGVTALAKESPDAVYVLLEADPRDPDVACTDDYRPVQKVVRLQAPLGDRLVFDAASGKQVSLS